MVGTMGGTCRRAAIAPYVLSEQEGFYRAAS